MGKNILILGDAFNAPTYMVRMQNLARNLISRGHQCTFATEQMPGVDFRTDYCPYFGMPYYRHKGDRIRWWQDKLFLQREKMFMPFVEQHVDVNSFDLILCSSFNDFPLLTAERLSRKYHKPLLVDLRDITEQWGDTAYTSKSSFITRMLRTPYERRAMRIRNRVLRHADAVTTVSPWHRDTLSRYNSNTSVIFNGFDADEYRPQDTQSSLFFITYLGRLYDLKFRSPQLIFQAVARLQNDCPKMRILFHTDEEMHQPLRDMAQRYGAEKQLLTRGFVSRKESIRIMHEASVLTVLTAPETEHGPHGIMTTKFFEAMGVSKPVLAVESNGGCLHDVIQQTGAGLATDQSDEVVGFLLSKYREWEKSGCIHQPISEALRKPFSRQDQALQFEQIILQITKQDKA